MNKGSHVGQVDLQQYLTETVYPALYDRLDTAFPGFDWKRGGASWTARLWPADFPFPVGSEIPDRLMVYASSPWLIRLRDHAGVRLLDYVNRGRKPVGPELITAARALCDLAGVPFPEREYTEEEQEKLRKTEERKTFLQAAIDICQEILWSDKGRGAREYLLGNMKRPLTEDEIRNLGLGYFSSVSDMERRLQEAGQDLQAVRDAAFLWPQFEGYIIFPWLDAAGAPLTIYGTWFEPNRPEGKPTKLALSGEATKGSPLYFDRARKAGHTDIVAVEGVFEAAMAQVRGDTRVVAYLAGEFSGLQVETMKRHRVRSVTICPDPDGGGDAGALSSVESLRKAGIASHVTPHLPDRMTPDEYITAHGIGKWKEFVAQAVPGAVHRAKVEVGDVSPESPVTALREAVDKIEGIAAELRGPRESLDREDLLEFCSERTGYSRDSLREMFEAARKRREREQRDKDFDALLREAQSERLRNRSALEAMETLRSGMARLEGHAGAEPVLTVREERKAHEGYIETMRDRWYVGLAQETLPTLDSMTLGLRGLMLMAAAPGSGRTALGVQLGLDAVTHNRDACFLFLCLDMPRKDVYIRMKSRLAEVDWKRLVNGYYTNEEMRRIKKAEDHLDQIGDRLLVLDGLNSPTPTVEGIIDRIDSLKARTGTSRAFVLMDYLQILPVPGRLQKNLRTDLEEDKWRIGAINELQMRTGDAVMVISETRRPGSRNTSGGDMEDVTGAARGICTPSMVFLLQQLDGEDLLRIRTDPASLQDNNDRPALLEKVKEELTRQGLSIVRLRIPKGRDGVTRGSMYIHFHFRQSRFEEPSDEWEAIYRSRLGKL